MPSTTTNCEPVWMRASQWCNMPVRSHCRAPRVLLYEKARHWHPPARSFLLSAWPGSLGRGSRIAPRPYDGCLHQSFWSTRAGAETLACELYWATGWEGAPPCSALMAVGAALAAANDATPPNRPWRKRWLMPGPAPGWA